MSKYAAGGDTDKVVPWEIQNRRIFQDVYKEKRPPNKVVTRVIGFIIVNLVIFTAIFYLHNL